MSSTSENSLEPYDDKRATAVPFHAQGWQNAQNLDAIKKLAEKNDPSAIALLNLYEKIRNDYDGLKQEIKNESSDFERRLVDYERGLKRTDGLIIGALIFVGVSFLTTISLVFFDLIKEKEIYLRYNDIYKNYSDTILRLDDKNNQQIIDFNNLKNELKSLRDKNPYLK